MLKINIILKQSFIILLLAVFGCPFMVKGQSEHPLAFLRKIKKANASPVICYEYTVRLLGTDNKAVDSTKGKLFKNGLVYLDSNNATITARNESYYFNLNHPMKTVTVLSIDSLKKQMGVSLDAATSDIIAIPDSIILKYGKVNMENLPNGNYMIRMTFRELQFSKVDLEIDKNSLMLVRVQLTSQEESGYRQLYSIYNVRYDFDNRALSLNRFFTINNNRVVVNKKYSGYQTNTITN